MPRKVNPKFMKTEETPSEDIPSSELKELAEKTTSTQNNRVLSSFKGVAIGAVLLGVVLYINYRKPKDTPNVAVVNPIDTYTRKF